MDNAFLQLITKINFSNYIMFEDINNQCSTKTDVAIDYYNNLSSSEKDTFLTSTDYVISTARERFNAWLINQGKIIGGDNNIQSAKSIEFLSENNSSIIVIIILSLVGVVSLGSYFYFHKKKGDYHA